MAYEITVISDAHHEPGIPTHPSYLAAIKFIKDVRPKYVVIIGDFGDFQCFSHHHNINKPLRMEGKRYGDTCMICRNKLEEIRPFCDEMEYIEGNHEFWTYRYVERHPEMEGYIDWIEDFGLYDLGIGYTPYNDILSIGRVNFTHGKFTNKYHASKHLDNVGDNIFYGHTHTNQKEIRQFKLKNVPYISESIGCLCSKSPSYVKGWGSPNIVNGFLHIEVWDEDYFTPHFFTIINGAFSYGKTIWRG